MSRLPIRLTVLLASLLAVTGNAFAGVPKTVLVEEFTATW